MGTGQCRVVVSSAPVEGDAAACTAGQREMMATLMTDQMPVIISNLKSSRAPQLAFLPGGLIRKKYDLQAFGNIAPVHRFFLDHQLTFSSYTEFPFCYISRIYRRVDSLLHLGYTRCALSQLTVDVLRD